MGIPASNIIGAPFSGWLLGIEGHGFKGWQWMYILEGIPTLALGFAALWCLPDNPRKARFLTEREKDVVMARLADQDRPQVHSFGEMMWDWRVWALIIPDFAIVFGIYALGFWMPQMVKAMGYSIMETSLIVMIPYAASVAILWGIGVSSRPHRQAGAAFRHFRAGLRRRFSDRCPGRRPQLGDHRRLLPGGGRGLFGPCHLLVGTAAFLGGTAAAGAFALINSVGNLSGFVGPGLMGLLLQTTGSYTGRHVMCTGVALVAALSMAAVAGTLPHTHRNDGRSL